MRDYFLSKHFLRQLLIALAISVTLIWGSLKLLDLYTLHGRSIEVPSLEGLPAEQAFEQLSRLDLRYVINDSIFDNQATPGSIAMHDPAPGRHVKRNRTIYLTKVAVLPEMVPMPNLVDLSRRQAMTLLETHGLKVGRLEYEQDIALNAVLRQQHNNAPIEPGTPVEKGTTIDLVLGEGLGDNTATVPLVIGMKAREAIQALNHASLNVGEQVYLDEDQENARVYLQSPDPLTRPQYLEVGSLVNLTFRSANAFDFDSYLEQLLSVSLPLLAGRTPEEVEDILRASELEVGLETFTDGATRENAVAFRQEPQYQEGQIIAKGQSVDIWYRPMEDNQQ